ncbi:SdpI family protein [Hymenobacter gummosus]|uniref:SdpI family protein n=1 Tax=Hymenobacter gummosus TaxID=1776032 RepID=A0A3S0K6C9_9BACT|nr:SdpI family protein [Hymenobacter gummosus]RTQ50697.1 SdpI family protein [Hymenobacter gummosus]
MTNPIDLLVLAAICGLMLLVAGLTRYRPPQQINWLYGYRTARSMRNAATWQAANSYFARYFWRLSWTLPVVATAAALLLGLPGALLILAVVLVAGLLFGAVRTERHLQHHFDEQGQLRG